MLLKPIKALKLFSSLIHVCYINCKLTLYDSRYQKSVSDLELKPKLHLPYVLCTLGIPILSGNAR